jgi:hypothetical protein
MTKNPRVSTSENEKDKILQQMPGGETATNSLRWHRNQPEFHHTVSAEVFQQNCSCRTVPAELFLQNSSFGLAPSE